MQCCFEKASADGARDARAHAGCIMHGFVVACPLILDPSLGVARLMATFGRLPLGEVARLGRAVQRDDGRAHLVDLARAYGGALFRRLRSGETRLTDEKNADRVASGDLTARLTTRASGEAGRLLDAVETMTNDLRALIGRIQKSSNR